MIDLARLVVDMDVTRPRPGEEMEHPGREAGDLFPLRGPTPPDLLVVIAALPLPMFSFPVARGILGHFLLRNVLRFRRLSIRVVHAAV